MASSKLSRTPTLTTKDVASRHQCSDKTIRRAIARGELKAYRLGKSRAIRISEYDLARWIRPVTPLAGVVANA